VRLYAIIAPERSLHHAIAGFLPSIAAPVFQLPQLQLHQKSHVGIAARPRQVLLPHGVHADPAKPKEPVLQVDEPAPLPVRYTSPASPGSGVGQAVILHRLAARRRDGEVIRGRGAEQAHPILRVGADPLRQPVGLHEERPAEIGEGPGEGQVRPAAGASQVGAAGGREITELESIELGALVAG